MDVAPVVIGLDRLDLDLQHLPGPRAATATGPVQMWPGNILRLAPVWIAGSAGGTTSGGAGIMSGAPDTVEIVTRSPLPMVASGASRASKKPQWTVSGVGSRWIGIENPRALG